MAIKDLVPKIVRGRERVPSRRGHEDPFHDFQDRMNRLFDDFFDSADFGLMPRTDRGLERWAGEGFLPRVDVSETDKEVVITAELPGMEEKDINVELDNNALTIHGEKREEKEDEGKQWHTRELSYGSFHRVVPLPAEAETENARAKFKKGVLTVNVPKSEAETSRRRKIQIDSD